MSHRLFVAVVPPEDVVEDLEGLLAPRRDTSEGRDLRWTSPESWHVTLAFMGHVPQTSLDDLEERLDRAARRRRPFTLTIGGGGAFPDVAQAKLLYAGVHGEPDELEELRRLATGARAAGNRAGAPSDGARFRPHVTVARTRRPGDVVRWARLLDTWTSRRFEVDAVELVESFLGEGPRGRPRYETRSTHPVGRTRD